jgi:hypothetical protein
VKALLSELGLRRVQARDYRFCGNPACDVVYFAEAGDQFGREDIRVPVWHKERPGSRMLCYCFGETEAVIRAEALRTTTDRTVTRIRDHIAHERCACEVRNHVAYAASET